MDIDKVFQDQLIKITQEAAISVYPHLGKKDKIVADEAATNSMRTNLNKMNIKGNIVIGEGEMDEAPMLYIGEKVGTKNGPEFDIAVDPLEGTNFAAKNLPGAISVIAISNRNDLFNAPESYMEKISYPKDIDGVLDFHRFVKACIADSRLPIKVGDFQKCWGIKYMEGDYSGLHNHTPGKQMTAVLFLTGAEKSIRS